MTTPIHLYRLRFPLQLGNHNPMNCALTGAAPKIWRGVDVQIEAALFDRDGYILDDFTGLASLVCELHTSDRDAAALVQKTVLVGAMTACTLANWNGKAAANRHALFSLANADTQVSMDDTTSDQQTFWLVFHAVKTTGEYITCGCANLIIEEDGAQNGLDVVGNAGTVYRVSPTTGLPQFYNPDTGKWHSFQPRGPVGAVVTAWEQNGEE